MTSAQEALDNIDTAIDSVNGYRSDGSVQNRLDSALNNSQVYMEALSLRPPSSTWTSLRRPPNLTKLQIATSWCGFLSQAKNIKQSVISLLSDRRHDALPWPLVGREASISTLSPTRLIPDRHPGAHRGYRH